MSCCGKDIPVDVDIKHRKSSLVSINKATSKQMGDGGKQGCRDDKVVSLLFSLVPPH